MTRSRSLFALLVTLVLLGAVALAQKTGPDQANAVEGTTSLGTGAEAGSLFQSFTPAASRLGAVSLQLRPGNAFPAEGCETTVRIRAGAPDGPVVGRATGDVPAPGAEPAPTVTFQFEPPIELKPGETYVIEWVSPEGGESVLALMATEKDTYANGSAFDAKGAALAGQDFVFATYEGLPDEAVARAQEAEIAQDLAEGLKLVEGGDIAGATPRFQRLLERAGALSPDALTANEWFAVGCAHCYLMAAAFDQAVQSGDLDRASAESAVRWRDLVFAPPEQPVQEVTVIGQGQEVNLAEHLTPGKTNIIDFYSEYCGPCRAISPKLEALAGARDDIVVVKVDINRPGVEGIDWQSPVARQFRLQSVPSFKVYGPDGKLQMEGDAAYEWVIRQVGG